MFTLVNILHGLALRSSLKRKEIPLLITKSLYLYISTSNTLLHKHCSPVGRAADFKSRGEEFETSFQHTSWFLKHFQLKCIYI